MHYLTSGGASFRFSARKQEFLLPVIILLRALSGVESKSRTGEGGFGCTDEEVFRRIMQGAESNTFLRARAELLLQDANRFEGLHTSEECLAYLGGRFRAMSMRAESTSDVDVGHYMIRRCVNLTVSLSSPCKSIIYCSSFPPFLLNLPPTSIYSSTCLFY